jgi:multidrug efflux pump subunit AcrA (membrane-fusion protein)
MRLGTAAIVAFGCAALVLSAALSYSAIPANKPATPAAASTPAVPVVAEQVKSSDVPIYLGGIGSVQAYNTVTVHGQITGPMTQIAFTEGQLVRTGDLLAQIDPRPYQAQLANAQQILERNLPLLPKGFVAQQTVETEKDQVARAAATVQADETQIESARVQLSYTRLSSPIDGVTGIRGIDIGNSIHPTDPNGLVVVTQLQPISVIFTLPETDLPRIQEAMAKGTLTARIIKSCSIKARSQSSTIRSSRRAERISPASNGHRDLASAVCGLGDARQHRLPFRSATAACSRAVLQSGHETTSAAARSRHRGRGRRHETRSCRCRCPSWQQANLICWTWRCSSI